MKAMDVSKEIENIKNQLIEKYKPGKIILFGSASWSKGEINDIDLFIIKTDIPYYGIDRMRELDQLIERNIATDMLVYRPEEIKEMLRKGGLCLTSFFSTASLPVVYTL
jgi:hypothetical protein